MHKLYMYTHVYVYMHTHFSIICICDMGVCWKSVLFIWYWLSMRALNYLLDFNPWTLGKFFNFSKLQFLHNRHNNRRYLRVVIGLNEVIYKTCWKTCVKHQKWWMTMIWLLPFDGTIENTHKCVEISLIFDTIVNLFQSQIYILNRTLK